VSWKSPSRAGRVVIYEEGAEEPRQYWRSEDDSGKVLWRAEPPVAGQKPSGNAITTAELVKAVESSLQERRHATRGRTFRL
jgi:hypothetical protein